MRVDFYCEENGKAPVLEWLREFYATDRARYYAPRDLIRLLGVQGHLLRMPHSKPVGEGLFELRVQADGVQVRIFYFFHGAGVAVAAHHLAKKDSQRTPKRALELSRVRMARFKLAPERHRFVFDLDRLAEQ